MDAVDIEVVLPCHNAGSYLVPAVESILAQSHRDFRLVVIDDGSTDGACEMLSNYSDPRLCVISHAECKGVAACLNSRINETDATYLAVMHADDIALPQRLEVQYAVLQHTPSVGVLGAAVELIGEWQGVRHYPLNDETLRVALLFDSPFSHSAVMLRVSMLRANEMRYCEHLLGVEDYELWARIPRDCVMANCEEVLLQYRVHEKQFSQVAEKTLLQHADYVRQQQLAQFGIAPSTEELGLHSLLGRRTSVDSLEQLKCADTWLLRLIEHNASAGCYVEQVFIEYIESLWWIACQRASELGEEVCDIYLTSAVGSLRRRTTAEIAHLLKSCVTACSSKESDL